MNKEKIIIELFEKLNFENVKYCILRNYENLPWNSGNDIDILIDTYFEHDIYVYLKDFTKNIGWEVLRVWNRNNMQTFILYSYNEDFEILKLDIWTKLSWRNVRWIDERYILENCENYGLFKIPNNGAEGAILLIKESFGKGKIPNKYKDRIQKLLIASKSEFVESLYSSFGENTNLIYKLCIDSNWNELDDYLKSMKFELIKNSLLTNLVTYLKYNLNYLVIRFLNIFKIKGNLIVFLGPDGSGKTTIINRMEKELLNFYPKSIIFHTRLNIFPELKTGLGLSNPKSNIDKETKVEINVESKQNILSIVLNSIVVLYYYLEFLVGNLYLWSLKKKGYIIIFDRYFYDFFIQPNTRKFIWKFKKILLMFIMKPECVVHLYAEPEIIYARKQELTIEEIRAQNSLFEKLFLNDNRYFKIDTSEVSLDSVEKLVLSKIISNTTNDLEA